MRQVARRSVVSFRRVLATAAFVPALLLLQTASTAAVAPLALAHDYYGTYSYDGSTSSDSIHFVVETQRGRKVKRLIVFAANSPELKGTGKLSRDNTKIKIKAMSFDPPRTALRLILTTTVGPAGDTLAGTFVRMNPGLPTLTGTFSVSR